MEMAHIFSHLGAEVTVLEAMERILPTEDEEVSEELVSLYRKIRFVTSARVTGIEKTAGFRVTAEREGQSDTFSAQHLLLCIGRKSNIPAGAQELGIRFTNAGGIETDGHMQTNLPGIYAIGDVTGGHMYAYVAAKEAEVAVDHITGGSRSIDYSLIPSVTFTGPEVASVGRSQNLSLLQKGTFPVSALGRARTMEASEGFATVYASPAGRIERVTIVAPHATELIAWATLAISRGLTLEEFLDPYYAHPTMAELVKEAAEDIRGLSIHKP
jgi:dihydrolipoamide dehydrogenase